MRIFWFVLFFSFLHSVVFSGQHPYFSKHKDKESQLETYLRKAGLEGLEMQPADLSVSLTSLQNQKSNLEAFKGKVFLLTKWATWCGACKSEMPTKIQLTKSMNNPRFAVVGISDESIETVKAFQSTQTTYPHLFVDENGNSQKFFPGNSIPVTVLVDAWGWILAMRKGGLNWNSEASKALIQFLLAQSPSKEQFQEKVPPPRIVFRNKYEVVPEQLLQIPFHVSWNGEQDKYSRMEFSIPSLRGIRYLGVSLRGQSASKSNERTYYLQFKLQTSKPSKISKILFRYQLKDYDKVFEAHLGSIQVTPKLLKSVSSSKRTLQWLFLCCFLFFGVLFFALSRKPNQPKKLVSYEPQENKDWEKIFASFSSLSLQEQLKQLLQLEKDHLLEENESMKRAYEESLYGGKKLDPSQVQEWLQATQEKLKSAI